MKVQNNGVFVWHSNRRNLMRMLSIFSAIATSALAIAVSPVQAKAGEPVTFERDGTVYTYRVEQQGEVQIIKGISRPDAGSFNLRVRGNRVVGVVNGRTVSFALPKDGAGKPQGTELSMR
jgi:hypothetical protein